MDAATYVKAGADGINNWRWLKPKGPLTKARGVKAARQLRRANAFNARFRVSGIFGP